MPLNSSESDVIKRLNDIVKAATPSITRSQDGLSITLNGKTSLIAFEIEGTAVSTSTLTQK
ncbi:hypothetical protein [Pseudanabaena sp. 'Roaring Creek']|uniref:hypothetical protein n=1 Tax=Pseudanabaena sp. 'Roaring Creek' TaxID=1681830 RepID=UPI0006D80F61|nr:hypothetical protein [Pseudanabaena sp. 'Roaring Creek']